jgi:FlaA1/EpsC-like NDP-sugar epimerase
VKSVSLKVKAALTSTKKSRFDRDWNSFLNRDASANLEVLQDRYGDCLAQKRILVTGAGGYIGSALAKSIAQSCAKELILLDASEGALYDIHQALSELKNTVPHVPSLASICDGAAICHLFDRHRPDIVFHTAAFKHVPLMEDNPFAAVDNNAIGTHILTETAVKYGCEQLLMISTDKAVDPLSIMGASKRIAELILLAPRAQSICTKIVRLGNVLGSSGSVVPLFLRQIANGGPVTVSHPDVRRYFMTLAEAVETLLCAASADSPKGLLIPEPGDPIRILDLARYLIGQENEVPIVFTELRPGDKMEESLISKRESCQTILGSKLRTVHTPTLSSDQLSNSLDDLQIALQQRDLPSLLRTVQSMVPEYRPGQTLRTQLQISSSSTVNA